MPSYASYIENLLNINYKKIDIMNNGTLNELSPKNSDTNNQPKY